MLFGVLAGPAGAQEEVVCSLGPGGEVPATIVGAGFIQGTPGNDVIAGSPGRDYIVAGGGDDIVCGNGGNDYIDGGAGDDILIGGEDGPPFAAQGSADTLSVARGMTSSSASPVRTP